MYFNWNSWETWCNFVRSWVFYIHDNIFDTVQWNNQDNNIRLKFIFNEPNENESQCEETEIFDDNIQNKNKTINKEINEYSSSKKEAENVSWLHEEIIWRLQDNYCRPYPITG